MNNAIAPILEARKGGVWYLPTHVEVRSVQSAAKKADYAFFHIDGRTIERKEQLMNHVATSLRLPKTFGHNWDALEECLIEMDEGDHDGFVIYYDHIDGLLAAHPDQFETLVEILRDAVSSWKEDDTPMVVLLSGAKAPKGVAKLKGAQAD
ncbi:MAG: barstar family protein [Burkholderiales bacterium]|nr:barstar family protein [Burkholderiales bacterium]